MSAVIALLVVIFGLLWGSAVLISYLQSDPWKKSVSAGDDEAMRRLHDEVEELRRRLADVEDKVSFDRQLAPPPSGDDANRYDAEDMDDVEDE